MQNNPLLDQLKEKVKQSQTVLLLLPPKPDQDSVVAALSLSIGLRALGKTTTLGCSTPVELNIEGVSEIKTTVGKQNLIISFPYREEAIEHVSYDIDEATNTFNLVIRPREGQEPLDVKLVKYNYTGASANLVITFGISSLEELGKIYADEKSFLDQVEIANLRRGGQPVDFTSLDLSTVKATSLAELVGQVLLNLGATLPNTQATILYRQMTSAIANFQSPLVTAETFDVAAYLLRSGATRFTPTPPPAPYFPTPPKPQITPPANTPKKPVPSDWQGPKIFRAGETK